MWAHPQSAYGGKGSGCPLQLRAYTHASLWRGFRYHPLRGCAFVKKKRIIHSAIHGGGKKALTQLALALNLTPPFMAEKKIAIPSALAMTFKIIFTNKLLILLHKSSFCMMFFLSVYICSYFIYH